MTEKLWLPYYYNLSDLTEIITHNIFARLAHKVNKINDFQHFCNSWNRRLKFVFIWPEFTRKTSKSGSGAKGRGRSNSPLINQLYYHCQSENLIHKQKSPILQTCQECSHTGGLAYIFGVSRNRSSSKLKKWLTLLICPTPWFNQAIKRSWNSMSS